MNLINSKIAKQVEVCQHCA